MMRLARWREAYWQLLIRRGISPKSRHRIRTVLIINGSMMAVFGTLLSFGMLIGVSPEESPQPGLLERFGSAVVIILIMTIGGSLAVYFGMWKEGSNQEN